MGNSPPIGWLVPLAFVFLTQLVRLGRLTIHTRAHIGNSWVNNWTYLFFIPPVLAALNADALPSLAPTIQFVRQHFLAIIVVMLIVGELLIQSAIANGIARLASLAERLQDNARLAAIADALTVLGALDFALVVLERLAERTPTSKLYSHMASLHGILRRFGRAETAARRALELDPTNAFAHYSLGMIFFERGHREEAFVCFRSAREHGMALPEAYYPNPRNQGNP